MQGLGSLQRCRFKSPALLSGLKDPELPKLWHSRSCSLNSIPALARDPPYALGVTKKKKKVFFFSDFGVRKVKIVVLSLIGHRTLDELFSISELVFSHL